MSKEKGRLFTDNEDLFNPDPRIRHTFWTVLVGQCTGATITSWCCRQDKVQRYFSVRSRNESQLSVLLSGPGVSKFNNFGFHSKTNKVPLATPARDHLLLLLDHVHF